MSDNGDTPQNNTATLLPLQTNALSLEYDGARYVDTINLTLQSDKLTVIMGPNGAGKSLLLRLLHGLIVPTNGQVKWNGLLMDDATRKRQAMVFQRPILLRRSVAANIDFILKLNDKRDQRDRILNDVGLLDFAQQPARSLSVGEQQRLALARALATEPEVLFLDEPTASLDPASVLVIEQIVMQARQNGTRMIFVTHDIGQAKRLADEVVFLHRGQLAEHTPAKQFFSAPTSTAAEAYLDGRILL